MDEKILIKSKPCSIKPFVTVVLMLCIAFSACVLIPNIASGIRSYNNCKETYRIHQVLGYCDYDLDYDYITGDYERTYQYDCINCQRGKNLIGTVFKDVFEAFFFWAIIPVGVLAVTTAIAWVVLRSYELTVTDKRVYGKLIFGKRIDIPLDSISSVATTRVSCGVMVASSSGRIVFGWLNNHKEIYEIINELLLKRNDAKSKVYVSTPAAAAEDETEKLKKYKALLDSGVITQEEFDAKKKELLGL